MQVRRITGTVGVHNMGPRVWETTCFRGKCECNRGHPASSADLCLTGFLKHKCAHADGYLKGGAREALVQIWLPKLNSRTQGKWAESTNFTVPSDDPPPTCTLTVRDEKDHTLPQISEKLKDFSLLELTTYPRLASILVANLLPNLCYPTMPSSLKYNPGLEGRFSR